MTFAVTGTDTRSSQCAKRGPIRFRRWTTEKQRTPIWRLACSIRVFNVRFRTLFEVNSRARRPEQPCLTWVLMAAVLLVSRRFVKAG